MRQGDIENASRPARYPVGNLLGINLNRDIHRKERDFELLLGKLRFVLRDIRIRTTHASIIGREDRDNYGVRSFLRSAAPRLTNSPTGNAPSEYLPMLIRTSLSTGRSMASHIR